MAVHPTAIVSPAAEMESDIEVGPFSIIHGNVRIASGTQIGSNCEIGHPTPLAEGLPLVIGANALIRSHSILYEGSTFGDGLVTGHRVTVREKTEAGCKLQIGTLSDIQGHCRIGNYVRLHSNVHIGQRSLIEDFVWLFPYVVLTNDPHPPSELLEGVTLRRFSVIATMSVLLPGVTVGEGALVGASSLVSRNVPANTVAAGVPAKNRGLTRSVNMRDGSNRPAYPWRRHFHRGYPQEIVRQWAAEFEVEDFQESR